MCVTEILFKTMNRLSLKILLIILVIIAACQDDEAPTTPPDPDPINLEFTGVQMTDANGTPIGCYNGDCMDDWTNISLTTDELTYLAFDHNIPNANPELGEAQMYPIYPNPMGNTGNMGIAFETTGRLIFKMVVIDTMGNAFITHVSETQSGFNNIQLSYEVFEGLERKTIYRMYYAFYDVTSAPVYTGYGDFGICEEDFNPNPQDCFE